MDTKIGSEYNGFVVVGNYHFDEDNADGIYLRHKESGLEVFHILDDSKENGFAFAFRTVAKNSKGNAHILEHSVLCGSEKYDLKEPFTTLNNQGVLTFSNAFTYPEKTVYPASSVVKKDYYTAFDVYADAVFFPRLTKQTFMQEGWRVEYDEDRNPSIQGVVYNEMKGAYSDPTSIKYENLFASMYPSSYYKYDSGGNPANIPELTYEDFVAFHDKFYSPSNCLLVLMGNFSTEEQLDHINETLTDRLIKKYGVVEFNKKSVSKVPTDIKKLLEVNAVDKLTESVVNIIGDESDGESVSFAFSTNLDDTKVNIIDRLLFGSQTSPFIKSMLNNDELGVLGSLNGVFGSGRNQNVINLGLDRVKPENRQKVFDFIKGIIQETAKNGFSKDDIESALMKEDMSLRRKGRYSGGPLNMTLAINIIDNWIIGIDMDSDVESIKDFEAVKDEVLKNPSIIMDWYNEIFINNNSCIKFVAKPSSKFIEEQNKAEKANLDKLIKKIDKDTYLKELDDLHIYQSKVETNEDVSCIPKSSTDDLTDDLLQDVESTEFFIKNNKNGKNIPALESREYTRGMTRLKVMYPIDNISPKDLKYVSLLSELLGYMGTKNLSWSEASNARSKYFVLNVLFDSYEAPGSCLYVPKNIGNRSYLSVVSTFLNDRLNNESLDYLADFINNTVFDDTERFQSMLKEFVADYKSSLPTTDYIMTQRTRMDYNTCDAKNELMQGISYAKFILGLDLNNTKKLQKKLNKVFKDIKKSGVFIHYTSDLDWKQSFGSFVEKINAVPPKPVKKISIEKILKNAYYPKRYDPNNVITVKTDVMVGFAAYSYKTGDVWGSHENACRNLAFNHMGMHQLWEKVRTMNGAYGAHALNSHFFGLATFTSYRDPNPRRTLELFTESVKDLRTNGFTKDDLESSALSWFGDFTVPTDAFTRGEKGLRHYLHGTTTESIHKMVNETVHGINEKDVVHEVDRATASMVWASPRRLVVVPKSDTTTENVIEL